MAVVGIITEYNPFHKGHERQIEKLRNYFAARSEEVTVVSLMSGNFVERGDFAIVPKGYRAMTAVKCGADLVLELPYPYSGSCAEIFGFAGVYLLDRLGVDYLAFGSESGDLALLEKTEENFSSPFFERLLSKKIAENPSRSYAQLREEAYAELYGEVPPSKPNDILGVAYLAALHRLKSKVKPLVIKREGLETATASRRVILNENYDELNNIVPQYSCDQIQNLKPVSMRSLEKAILSFLRLADPRDLSSVAEMPDGFAFRLVSAAKKCHTLEELLEAVATKVYTHARIRRCLLSAILGVTKKRLYQTPTFTRLLAANQKGRAFLATVAFPILTRGGDSRSFGEEVEEAVAFADRADSFYALADENPPLNKPFIL